MKRENDSEREDMKGENDSGRFSRIGAEDEAVGGRIRPGSRLLGSGTAGGALVVWPEAQTFRAQFPPSVTRLGQRKREGGKEESTFLAQFFD